VAIAVAGRGHLGDEVDEHAPVALGGHDAGGVLHHFLQKHRDGFVPLDLDVAVGADQDALGAADALFGSMTAFSVSGLMPMASWAQWSTHSPQPVHFLAFTLGEILECWESLPFREAQPMPRFFRAPPNPESSCSLKWVRVTNPSASTMASARNTDLNCFALDIYLHFGLAGEAVGDDQGGPHHRVGKAVFDGGGEMADGLAPGAHIHGVGVGEEGRPPTPDLVHHLPHVNGPDEGGVALLAEMQLHRNERPLLAAVNDALDIQGLQQAAEFLKIGLLGEARISMKYTGLGIISSS